LIHHRCRHPSSVRSPRCDRRHQPRPRHLGWARLPPTAQGAEPSALSRRTVALQHLRSWWCGRSRLAT